MSKRVDIPTEEPKIIRAGDTVKWTRSHGDYPASESWELKYYILKDGVELTTITASADGDDHSITITAATTTAWAAGRYFFQGRFEKGSEKYTEYEGIIEVRTELAGSSGHEWRIHAEQALENIEAILLNKATADNYSYTVAGRSLSKYSWAELMDMRDRYKAELSRFNRKYGNSRPGRIEVQFS